MDFPFFLKPYMGNLFEANKRYGKNERQKIRYEYQIITVKPKK